MRIKITKKNLIIFAFIGFLVLSVFIFTTPALASNTNCLDPNNAGHPDCAVPRLRGLQDTVVNLVYLLWVAGIPVFSFLGILIGYQFMTSGTDSDAKAQLQRRALYWVVSMFVFFASQPIAAAFMGFFITSTDDCYRFLNTPGFTFFFSNVCNPSLTGGGGSVIPSNVVPSGTTNPTPTALVDTDGTGNCCTDFIGCYGPLTISGLGSGGSSSVTFPTSNCSVSVSSGTCSTQKKCEDNVVVVNDSNIIATLNGKSCDSTQHNREVFFALNSFSSIQAVAKCNSATSIWEVSNSQSAIDAGLIQSTEDGVGTCCDQDGSNSVGASAAQDGCFSRVEISVSHNGQTGTISGNETCQAEPSGPNKKCASNKTCTLSGSRSNTQAIYEAIQSGTRIPCEPSNHGQIIDVNGPSQQIRCESDAVGSAWKVVQ